MTLQDFFQSTSHGAIAYSGGVDSSLLVWAAAQYGRDWRAYYVRTVFQPEFELLDAKKIAAECGIPLTILEGDILQFPEIRTNPADRCYHCKHRLFCVEQARLCLSRHPHSHRNPHHPRSPLEH